MASLDTYRTILDRHTVNPRHASSVTLLTLVVITTTTRVRATLIVVVVSIQCTTLDAERGTKWV